jgi:hypothetical protein
MAQKAERVTSSGWRACLVRNTALSATKKL